MKTPYLYDSDGTVVEKWGSFDGEAYIHTAKLFTTSKIIVTKEGNYFIKPSNPQLMR
ncbi:MAG: hypothetical protein SPF56_08960 [Bacteroidaceae bacterium]|nr:hypothetical protein [Bacteroidaceae bacterium]